MIKKLFTITAFLVLASAIKVSAMPARVVYSQDIDSNSVELKIAKGYGLTVDFIATGETIKQVWIGDPSRFTFTSNGNLCSKGDDQNCEGSKATVLFIRQIKPISFPNMTNSSDGSTQITVITNGNDGQKQYQFKLTPAMGQPSYTSLVIKPDSERPAPLLLAEKPATATTKKPDIPQQPVTSASNQSVTATSNIPVKILTLANPTPRDDANAVVAGLAVAARNGQIKPSTNAWNKTQDAIKLLRQGKSREEAISRSGISAQVFNQLLQWGQQ
ncbi:hypothetical protein FNW02_33870 [Komarekiella sp. 'clone 1']|uniref:Uncharacterized protein n=1 Tax=Komarekiella delphini-convector SJRDD-AB1 TaxID=2593771 RepID=A0AA40VV86_9NOST|nr:hypothetical protein [Komarekiella delphini-convector]MBD6620626.1 hypothetical protein [Komarekiella delphini-convector SJRDD-AB1]